MEQDKDAQAKMMEFQLLQQEIQVLGEQMKTVNTQLEELQITEETIQELPNLKKDNDVLIPLASGIYAKATINDIKHVVVNVGSKVVVEQELKDTKALVTDQKEKLSAYLEKLGTQLNQYYMRYYELSEEIKSAQ